MDRRTNERKASENFNRSKEILTAYQRLGVFHLLAISGLHVGFIFSAIYFLLIRIGIPKERAQVTIMCLLPIYMILAGAPR